MKKIKAMNMIKKIKKNQNLIILFLIGVAVGYYLIPKLQTFVVGGQEGNKCSDELLDSLDGCISNHECKVGSAKFINTKESLGDCMDGDQNASAKLTAIVTARDEGRRSYLGWGGAEDGASRIFGGGASEADGSSANPPSPTAANSSNNNTNNTNVPVVEHPDLRNKTWVLMNRLKATMSDEEKARIRSEVENQMAAAGVTPHYPCGRSVMEDAGQLGGADGSDPDMYYRDPITCHQDCNAEYGFCDDPKEVWNCIFKRNSLRSADGLSCAAQLRAEREAREAREAALQPARDARKAAEATGH